MVVWDALFFIMFVEILVEKFPLSLSLQRSFRLYINLYLMAIFLFNEI